MQKAITPEDLKKRIKELFFWMRSVILNFSSQVKLLRVLQDQTFESLGDPNSITVDVRILSATNHDLYSLVKKGSFREDLLYRINLIQIEVPPLRRRTGDILLLAKYFIEQAAKTYSVPLRELSKDGELVMKSAVARKCKRT